MFPVAHAELLRAEVLDPALPAVKDLKPQAGISQIWRASVDYKEATSAGAMCWFPTDSSAGQLQAVVGRSMLSTEGQGAGAQHCGVAPPRLHRWVSI